MGTETQKLPLYLRPGNGGENAHPHYNSRTGPAGPSDKTDEEAALDRTLGMFLAQGKRNEAHRLLEERNRISSTRS